MLYMARQEINLAHRDLKPENCLVDGAQGAYKLRLADFGFCTRIVTQIQHVQPDG